MAKRPQMKLSLWSALPPFLGGKRRLCPVIFRELDALVPRRHWPSMTFLDGFLGGGSVSLYAKAMGFAVTSTDIAERSIIVGTALIENTQVRLNREDILKIAAPHSGPPGVIETKFVPSTFTPEQGRFLDRTLAIASETPDPYKAALLKLLAIRVMLLAHPFSQTRKGTIHRMGSGEYENITESCLHHYVDGWKLTRPKKLWDLAQRINSGIFQGQGRVIKQNVIEVLPSLNADVAYLDPPYPGVMSYEREYKVIDAILEGCTRPTSPFTAKDGASLIDHIWERAKHFPIWILSLGNEVVTLHDLEAMMQKHGRKTKALEIQHQHLEAVATESKKVRNKELLVLGWDETLLGRMKHE